MPSTTIYIVLDNVSEFEGSATGYKEEMHDIVSSLRQIVWKHNNGQAQAAPRLKVLLTCAERSISLFREVDPKLEHVSLMSGIRYQGDIRLR